MNLQLEERCFVVGGGSRGLGRAIAEELVGEGARVVLVGRDPATLEAAVRELGAAASYVAADLADAADIDAVIKHARSLDRLDGIVINGGGPPPGPVLGVDEDGWQLAFDMLIGGPLRLIRGLAPALGEDAALLFVTSSSVRQLIPNLDTSNVLRPGVAALVKSLARDLDGPRVNAIAPGRFDTDRVRTLDQRRAADADVSPAEIRERASAGIPAGRYGDPAELGRVAAFLLSPAASYINAASIQVDGGLVTAVP